MVDYTIIFSFSHLEVTLFYLPLKPKRPCDILEAMEVTMSNFLGTCHEVFLAIT